jgi:hypothetical protein
MADRTYDPKNDVEHVEGEVDKPQEKAIPYPRTLQDMPDPPSAEDLALGFELQKQDMAHGCQYSPGFCSAVAVFRCQSRCSPQGHGARLAHVAH